MADPSFRGRDIGHRHLLVKLIGFFVPQDSRMSQKPIQHNMDVNRNDEILLELFCKCFFLITGIHSYRRLVITRDLLSPRIRNHRG